jgi:hypothetical protein
VSLQGEVLPWFENRKKELANRPLIREQAFGEALESDKLERLRRYEVHLDRELERMLPALTAQGFTARKRRLMIRLGKATRATFCGRLDDDFGASRDRSNKTHPRSQNASQELSGTALKD